MNSDELKKFPLGEQHKGCLLDPAFASAAINEFLARDRLAAESVCAGADGFQVKGEAQRLPSGLNRQSEDGKIDYLLVRDGPMYKRWAELMTKAIPKRGRRNWMLAGSDPATARDDLDRFRRGAARHMEQWLAGETDEDHAAAILFNVNGAEYVKGRLDVA